MMEPGIVRNKLSHVIARCVELRAKGHSLHPTSMMDRIEDAFGKLDVIKGLRKNNLVKIIVKDRLTTRLVNQQLELIRELDPNSGDLLGVTRHFDIYTFYRYNNKDLVWGIPLYPHFGVAYTCTLQQSRGVVKGN